jgi:hypothetical protein
MTQPKVGQAALSISVLDFAHAVNSFAAPAFRPPPVGMYQPGRYTPTTVPGEKYYIKKPRDGVFTDPNILNHPHNTPYDQIFVEWDSIHLTRLYDLDGRVVNQGKDRYSKTPTVPVVELELMKAIVEHTIESHSNITEKKHNSKRDVILSFMRADIRDLYMKMEKYSVHRWTPHSEENRLYNNVELLLDHIENAVVELETQVREFLGNYHWHVFNINSSQFNMTDLHIVRLQDYRITVWEEEHGEQFRAKTTKKIR